jgi:hypothetical protein
MSYKRISLYLLLLPFLYGSQLCIGYNQTSVTNQHAKNMRPDSNDVPVSKEKQRKELYQLLGKLPDRHRPISVTVVSREERDEIIVEKLLLDIQWL